MDIFAHGLWAGAAAAVGNRAGAKVRVRWFIWWGVFPDVLAFGLPALVGLWLRVAGGAGYEGTMHGGRLPHVHLGLPLYQIGHSLVVFAVVFGVSAIVARRPVVGLLGWPLHIVIDMATHSHRYYATRFLWPLSDYGFDGIPWWTPWFHWCTYGALAVVYLLFWRIGWLSRARR